MKYVTHEHNQNGYKYIWFMTEHGEAHALLYLIDGCDYGVLSHLSVKEEFRKRGIATALQIERERIIKDVFGLNESWLYVDKESWMRKWYERRGYEYQSDNEDEEGTVWMKKSL